MWIDRLTSSAGTHALELAARHAEERHKILAENVANIDTPDYHTKRLSPEAFQQSLKDALEQAHSKGEDRLELRGEAQVSTDREGRLLVEPEVEPAPNILFHDGSNAQLEELMTGVQDNALRYNLAMTLLGKRYDGLLKAITGRNA